MTGQMSSAPKDGRDVTQPRMTGQSDAGVTGGGARWNENAALPFLDWGTLRVLVTGATGMVGSWLSKELLDRGAFVVALVRDNDPRSELFRSDTVSRLSVVNGALEDYSVLERVISSHEIDTVIHLGAQAIVGVATRSPLATFDTNIRGTYNLLEACRVHASLTKRIVVASSDKAYGHHEKLPYTEDMPLLGRYPYEVSKSCGDLIAQSYHRTYRMPIGIVRCGNIFGGGDLNWSRIVPGTIRSVLEGTRPVIRSDGTYVRDYLYVKDAVSAYLSVAEGLSQRSVQGEAFNFSNESPVTVSRVVQEIQDLTGSNRMKPNILGTASQEIHSQWLSAAKARTVLGWRPTFSLKQGLTETIAWYRDFLGVKSRQQHSPAEN